MVCRGASGTHFPIGAQLSHTGSPTCCRPPPDFARFPFRLAGFGPVLTDGTAPTHAKSAGSLPMVAVRHHVGGRPVHSRVQQLPCRETALPRTTVRGLSTSARQRGPCYNETLTSGFRLSRHYPMGSHPTAFADGSLIQRRPREASCAPVRRFPSACFRLHRNRESSTGTRAGSGG